MDAHEARLHAMLDQRHGWPCLNDEDRAAIQWLLNLAIDQKNTIYRLNGECTGLHKQITDMRQSAEKASAEYMRIAVR